MKRVASEAELALRSQGRRRMIGAAVIMVAVVVLLPRLLDHSLSPKLPAETVAVVPALPAAAAPAPAAKPADETPAPLPPPEPLPEAAASTPATSPAAAASAPAKNENAKNDSAKPAASGFMVQAGVFAERDKAKALVKKLKGKGFKAFTDTVATDKGDRTRVRMGPFESREEAAAMAAKLQKAGEKSLVVAP